MTTHKPDLAALRGVGADAGVARPAFRWRTRIALPAAILLAAGALLAYSARASLTPAVRVRVAPVVAKARAAEAGAHAGESGAGQPAAARRVIAQAPGWVEPDPFPINVPALADGVVREVLVLEGERVERGQVVARLIDEEARLALALAEAEVDGARAGADRARASLSAAEARGAELRDEAERKRELVEAGAVSEGEFARLAHRLRAAESDVATERAAVAEAEAGVRRRVIMRDEAALRLARMEIVSPASGVVLSRAIEPGTRLVMTSPGPGEAHETGVVRLYDPERLQVRAEVPLADVASIGVGTPAEIETEARAGRVFRGVVTRLAHHADIQRNTVQVKVAVEAPGGLLRPEMLARVRFFSPGAQAAGGGTGDAPDAQGSLLCLVAAEALTDRVGESAHVWMVERHGGAVGDRARRQVIALGADMGGGYMEALSGVRAGDRVIVDPPAGLRVGDRVRVVGEWDPPAGGG